MATITCIKEELAYNGQVTAAVLPEGPFPAGCQTSLWDAFPQSVNRQYLINGRQPCESCVSDSSGPGASVRGGRARSDLPCDCTPRLKGTSIVCDLAGENVVLREFPQLLKNVLASSEPSCSSDNPFSVLQDIDEDGCTRRRRLGGKAKTVVSWFAGMGISKIADPPKEIECGGLRAAVRRCFEHVTSVQELSFKTVAKVEDNCCKSCLPRFEKKLEEWSSARVRPVEVDDDHVRAFLKAFERNVDQGWDDRRRPFIPNGNATLDYTRKQGGNWNVEEFGADCRKELVFSSGKPRVVTLYSAENTKILGPLHYSLYDSLRKKGWLLVGDPTDRHVQSLNGADFLSFDYQSATDNIKLSYVRAAISVLKKKATCLSDEEDRALDVLGNLMIYRGDVLHPVPAQTGQPMGSVMSFPLLCLINKTVVDLAMDRLLIGKKISFPEWSGHRCLINGDDLLTREPRKDTNLRGLIAEEGGKVGLVVNQEKTMVSESDGEINSTYFRNGKKERKFNAAAIWMNAGVEDVLGFASDATTDTVTFRKVVRANAHILAKQSDKKLDLMPPALQMVCRKDRKIRKAITSLPEHSRTCEQGVISMAERPEGYDLSSDDENAAMTDEIDRVRERGIAWAVAKQHKPRFSTRALPNSQSYRSVLKYKRTLGQELIPACYVRSYLEKKWKAVIDEDLAVPSEDSLPPGDGSSISILIDNIRAFKITQKAVRPPGTWDVLTDYVRLD